MGWRIYAAYRSTGMMALAFEADGTGSAQWQNGSLRLSVTAETGEARLQYLHRAGSPLDLVLWPPRCHPCTKLQCREEPLLSEQPQRLDSLLLGAHALK